MKVLLTGVAGFIGYHVAEALLRDGHHVVGIDNLNDYYDPLLKQDRLARLRKQSAFIFERLDLSDAADVEAVVSRHQDTTHVIHLAAQAGVRHSLVDPYAYVKSNVLGHVVLLEAVRTLPALEHIVYASSSSVYGLNRDLPFRESDRVDRPGSFYAVTKRTGELTAEAYAHLYGLRQTGLRFFTVYGPWGRPDMAYYKFAQAIMAGEPLTLYAGSGLARDFTYIDDIVSGVLCVLRYPPGVGEARLLNLGGDSPTPVRRLVELLELHLGCEARIVERARPRSDVESTWSCLEKMEGLTGWRPRVSLESGVCAFAEWFREYARGEKKLCGE
ncbi:NAD-dependent epimerase/dehydratase family protein [Kozakia baliensis]|uniref:NAD-dependent epimerase/dehydratase family protein n=1 Tax=Kozakia baliensis TaxID=153496 RepID=UPI00087CA5B2|nr:NAD-dependent epimerase/dehydratase family protein [Kozakia baliensis]AOX20673.1 protein CapI [Kozakia baliensis]